jgi:hypothetical protein
VKMADAHGAVPCFGPQVQSARLRAERAEAKTHVITPMPRQRCGDITPQKPMPPLSHHPHAIPAVKDGPGSDLADLPAPRIVV